MPRRKKTIDDIVSTATTQTQSRLLGVPVAVRNRIYELVFKKEGTCHVSHRRKDGNPKGLIRVPGLLLACKQTYAESVQLFYGKTIFTCSAPYRLEQWPRKLASTHRVLVKKIMLSPYPSSWRTGQMAATFKCEEEKFLKIIREWVVKRKEIKERVMVVGNYPMPFYFFRRAHAFTVLENGRMEYELIKDTGPLWPKT
ncbi:hypothetical protein CLAFUW4_12533 [Fulvia fulva]|uniref:Uncharacterized protein n=1 Tax=Passalora fulva TaxID=5499 RepID=A0A9Q8UT26_PASFU|nr:uncharacterized protein CLAFUR5_11559 [Fulvia fulva]KAK4617817.1 hypothetical protein CLAFUR4_12538 [Fulvia fulva]KAK4619115.1 hypothetical protein CLAFUR0_12549 [Fulvia fulva]UJO21398.1 hypothetical protein CLAFUR5_11559 [Fulvia fulva]WPV18625.1 hypothetical protein CLAFUW4_12533 [Fulvia fulva]WPV33528.1 hypothetical protein CLAFUW7_12540 [Fulvia fulva]